MKVIITVNSYYPLKDGVQFVTQYHAEGLVKKGHNVTVVTRKINNLPIYDVFNGVEIVRVNAYTKHTIHRGDKKKYQNKILELTNNADVLINVCAQTATTDWVFDILQKINCKKVIYMHGMMSYKWSKHNFKSFSVILSKIWNNLRWNLYYKKSIRYFRKYDGTIHLHEFDDAYKFFKKKSIKNCAVIENAAADDFFANSIFLHNKECDNYIICVANYIELKNQELCLDAFYKSSISKYSLIFIGNNETQYYHKLIEKNKELIKKFGKRDVKFLKNLNREDVIKYIRNAKIFLLGSNTEKYPVAIIEAMASGIPFISTDVGCVRLLPGGVVIKNSSEMAYWITKFCKDEKMANLYGDMGNYYAKNNLRIDNQIKKLEEYLCSL